MFVFFILAESVAQQVGRYDHVDGELWSSVRINFELSKKWELKTDHQFRTKGYLSEFNRALSEATLEFALNEHITLGIAGRYTAMNDNVGDVQGVEHHFRHQAEMEYKFDLARFEIRNRLRYQSSDELEITRAQGDFPSRRYRYKLEVGYNFRNWKWDPTIGGELFYFHERGAINGFRRIRLQCGVQNKLPGPNKIEVAYMYEWQQELWRPQITHIGVLKYTYTLKRKKKTEMEREQQ